MNTASVTTPGQVAAAAASAIAFGVFLWAVSPYFGWPMRPLKDERGSYQYTVFHWVVPFIFVFCGVVAEVVALIGAVTHTVWRTAN